MDEKRIKRINELAAKQGSDGLSEDEKKEQDLLRREYIDAYKKSLVSHLENVYIVDENGNKRKVRKKSENEGKKCTKKSTQKS